LLHLIKKKSKTACEKKSKTLYLDNKYFLLLFENLRREWTTKDKAKGGRDCKGGLSWGNNQYYPRGKKLGIQGTRFACL
jgi:hypothetical protein